MKNPVPFPVILFEAGLLGVIFVAMGSGYLWELISRLEGDQLFNFFEGLMWTAIGLGFAWFAFKKTKYRKIQIGASVSFVLFGISDFIEIRTGAWYAPWGLLVLKAACVLSLLIHLRVYRIVKKKNC